MPQLNLTSVSTGFQFDIYPEEKSFLVNQVSSSIIQGEILVSSGRTVTNFINGHNITNNVRTLKILSKNIRKLSFEKGSDFICGEECGSIPILVACLLDNEYYSKRISQDFVIIRKKKREKFGYFNRYLSKNYKKAILIDDISATGSSLCRCIKILNESGVQTVGAFTVLDKDEGAAEEIAKLDVPLFSLVKYSDLVK